MGFHLKKYEKIRPILLGLGVGFLAMYGCTSVLGAGKQMGSVTVIQAGTDPVPVTKSFVYLGETGPSVDEAFAQKAINEMNRVYANGCMEKEFLNHEFKSLKNIDGAQVKTKAEAWARYRGGAPYKLDLHWYKKAFSNVVGYTYNYNGKASETRIWSHTKFIYSVKEYANHLFHELSHQARAGGFVHYTFFQGSVPYELNDIAAICLR